MVHPLMPFITEEIWQKTAPQLDIEGDTIMLQPYPEIDEGSIDAHVDKEIEWLKSVIIAVRNIRGELNISPATKINVLLTRGSEQDEQFLSSNSQFLITLAKLESVTWLDDPEAAPLASMQVIGEMEVLVPMAGLIDISSELDRLGKEQDKLKKEISRLSGKLGNAKFVDNAPNEVVAKERRKLFNAETTLIQLQDQMKKIEQAGDE
jgi:valyl-tRNA synthetase